jgi:hydroxymethylpyrimidine/phosphomethylpyrimidine kinase
MKTALTIAGSDPTGGAGLQADLRVFHAMGVYGYSVPAALTAQNTRGVDDVQAVDEAFFERQLEVLLSDVRPDALKTGMLYAARTVELLVDALKRHALHNLVVDPVTVSSSGMKLVEEGALEVMRAELFPRARMVTPNIYEASLFTGLKVETPEDMEKAARVLRDMGPDTVVVTGGHLQDLAVDIYYDGTALHRVEARKISGEYHGTGCAFSAAITAGLAQGHAPIEAVRRAKDFMHESIKHAFHPGGGMGLMKH